MQRAAQCQCGAVKAQTDAEPQAVVACSCGWCQRRSGSPIGVLAYFQRENVKVSGTPVEFVRAGGSGKRIPQLFLQSVRHISLLRQRSYSGTCWRGGWGVRRSQFSKARTFSV